MERKRIANARQTAMRQRKFQRLARQQEEEDKRLVKEALESRKKERARLSAYLYLTIPKDKTQQPLRTRQNSTVKAKPSKPCIVQNQDFAARLRETMKAAAQNSFLRDETRQLFFRMGTHVPSRTPSEDLTWDQSRLLGSFDEETDNALRKCAAAKNLRVTFHPAAVLKEDALGHGPEAEGQLFSEQFGRFAESREGDVVRPLSPTIVFDGPDPDSSSNSSFLAQTTAETLSKPEGRFSIPQALAADEQKTSIDDLNAFLEEALKLRLENENATNRMIAEVTGLESRLDDLQPMTSQRACGLGNEQDETNRCSSMKDMLGVGVSQDTIQFPEASACSRDEDESQRTMLRRDCKVYRSEAWEVGFSDCDNCSEQQCAVPAQQDPEPTTYSEFPTFGDSTSEVASGKQCSTGGSSLPSYPARDGNYHSSSGTVDSRGFKHRARVADLTALSRAETSVLASIERLDWKLASAIARCRDSGLSDGHYSVQSAPTVISHGNGSTGSNNARRYDSARTQSSHCLNRSRRRQNVGLTNKRHDGRFSCSQSQPRGENFPQVVDRTLEPRCAPSNGREGVIVFHPDAYCLLNPVASP
ncbi:uncharacterized protein LOC9642123 [Selaginella moellendorffii]|nr:uncharacterized protein LOC9642123 [Selaginella moellendorffii]|eukprot:XP_002971362.2 uncharacterized protein LOC9642123 [Selaginella moellendorffii]